MNAPQRLSDGGIGFFSSHFPFASRYKSTPGLTEGSMLAGSIGFALGLAAVAATATCAASAIKRIAAAVVILREVVAMEHLQWAEGDQGWERTAEEVAHRARQA